ncbi:MAG: glycerate kinase [Chthoniobacterales bacterium]
MRILVAPDKFKGSLDASDAGKEIAAGLSDILRAAQITVIPVADGGEGTAEAIALARGGEWITCEADDALGRRIVARYLWLPVKATAVIEMSEAAGTRRLAPYELNPLRARTCGVGEMLLSAARRGAKEIVVGLGGSATNDGGFGMARTLGFRFLDAKGRERTGEVSELRDLARVVAPAGLQLPKIIAAADVRNPLLGGRGATQTFARQKGASAEDIGILEAALTKLADVVEQEFAIRLRDIPGAGAAGGCGFGLMAFCTAEMRSGFEVVAEMIHLETAIRDADVIVTCEGNLDTQTLGGKAPAGVARLARKFGKRVFAVVGNASDEPEPHSVFDGVFSLGQPPVTRDEAMKNVRALLRLRAAELAQRLSG